MPLYAYYVIFAGKSVHGSNDICPYQPRNKLRFLFLFFLFKQKQANNTGITWTNVPH